MNLYNNKNFKEISDEDRNKLQAVQESEKNGRMFGKINKFREYPKAARHNLSLFPNNYLDILDLKNEDKIQRICEEYKEFLNTNPNEQQLLRFINDNEYYVLIACLLKFYNFGHHQAYLFKEIQLGTQFRADYVLVGKGSGGYEFVFIELEHPSDKAFLESTFDLAKSYRSGINQVNDWRRYLDNHFSSLAPIFKRALKVNADLPSEFMESDSSRRHYVVVAGRRGHYELNKEKTYEIRRNEEKTSNVKLLHYDNLYDSALNIINHDTF